MPEEKYYVLTSDPDDSYLREYTKEQLLKRIAQEQEYYKEPPEYMEALDEPWNVREYEGCVIIKGTIVTPKPKEVVTTFEIE